MKYALVFGSFSFLLLYHAISKAGLHYLFIWPAMSFILISVGYGGVGPKIYGKDKTGTIPFWSKIIYFPYILYSLIVWSLVKFIGRENAIDKVNETIIIGRKLLSHEFPEGVMNVIDLTAEFEDPIKIRNSLNYIPLPILDADVPELKDLETALESIIPGRIYIHCAQGHGRTGLFTLALLAKTGEIISFEEGISLLQKVRPRLRLNKKQTLFIRHFINNFVEQNA